MKKAAIPDALFSGFSGFAASPALGACLGAASALTPSDRFPVTSFVPIFAWWQKPSFVETMAKLAR
jgi:hypothetical protein